MRRPPKILIYFAGFHSLVIMSKSTRVHWQAPQHHKYIFFTYPMMVYFQLIFCNTYYPAQHTVHTVNQHKYITFCKQTQSSPLFIPPGFCLMCSSCALKMGTSIRATGSCLLIRQVFSINFLCSLLLLITTETNSFSIFNLARLVRKC